MYFISQTKTKFAVSNMENLTMKGNSSGSSYSMEMELDNELVSN